MQLGSLKVFCDVARHRSFSQAAVANDITQSAASQIVSQLEKHMEAKLVDRSTRPLQLTTLGQTFYEGCKSLLQQYEELEAQIRHAELDVAGTVNVAAIYSVGFGDLGQIARRFAEVHPRAHVHVDYAHPDQVYQRVHEGTADLGLVSFPRKDAMLSVLPWREEPMVLACAPQHPLARLEEVRPRNLDGQAYVHFDRSLTIRRKVDRFLREQRVRVRIECEMDSIENIKDAVSNNAGVALLPEPTLQREVRAGTLVARPLTDVVFVRPLGIVHRRGHWLSGAARALLELLQAEEAVAQRASTGPHHEAFRRAEPAGNGHARESQARNSRRNGR
ncbi:MAG: LysR family transcriptional regulator [Gemmataceae bacterium]|nr:LysR family transcriptional regulator [Gemmataceae bacterium]